MDNILGPRNLRGIFGETFKIIRRNLLRLLAIVASVQVPLYIAMGVAQSSRLIILAIGASLLFIVAQAFLWGALIHAVSEQYVRQRVHIGRAYRYAWGRLWPLAGVWILIFLLGSLVKVLSNIHLFLGVVGFCVGIYIMIHWACALQAVLLEGLGPFKALSRSSALAQGNSGRILGLYLVLLMILFVILGVSNIFLLKVLAMAITAISVSNMAIIAFLALGIPITVIPVTLIAGIGYTLLYYDLRVRKEGYNLDSLATELHIKMDSDSHEKNL